MQEPIPIELKAMVDRELAPGERILWAGTPRPVYFTPKSTASFIFGIPWTLFALFWTAGAAGFRFPDFSSPASLFPLFGVPFILIGLGLLASPLMEQRKSRNTVYAVTGRRALIIEGGRKKTACSFAPDQLRHIHREERKDGTGNLIMGQDTWTDSDGDKHADPVGFMRIPDPGGVEKMLRDLAGKAEPAGAAPPPPPLPAPEPREAGDTRRKMQSVSAGKLLALLIFAVALAWSVHTGEQKDYEKARHLTQEEYAQGFEEYKQEHAEEPGPLVLDIVVVLIMAGAFFACYEIAGRILGWVLRKTLMRPGRDQARDGPLGPGARFR